MRRLAALLLGGALASAAAADTITTSLLVMDAGGDYFSCAGHAALRLESADFKLDRCFSYESEPMGFLLGRFLSGDLKMGMFRVPTKRFLEPYAIDRRGVRAYRLDLPQDVQRELWMILDRKVDEGIELPYDYLKRGCAQSILQCLVAATARCGRTLTFPDDRPYYHMTCRESFGRGVAGSPWTFFLLHLIVGTDADREEPRMSRIFVPADLLDLLEGTTLDGRRVLSDEGAVLMPSGKGAWRVLLTPTHVAFLILFLVLAAAKRFRSVVWFSRLVTGVLAAISLIVFAVTALTVFCTDIPGSTWNWLLVPFNPIFLIALRWRGRWALAYFALVVVWVCFMVLSPHTLTHPAYALIAVAMALHVMSRSDGCERAHL